MASVANETEVSRRVLSGWHWVAITGWRKYPDLSDSDREDAESAGLLGLLSAARTWEEGKGASWSSYAIGCIENRMGSWRVSQGRRHGRLSTVSLSEPAGESSTLEDVLPDTAPGILAAVVRRCDGDRLRRGLSKLPPKYRAVLVLRYFHYLTFREIGERCGIAYQVASRRHARGLELLKEAMRGN